MVLWSLFADTPMISWRRGAVWSLFLLLMLTLCWGALGMGEPPFPLNLSKRTWMKSVCQQTRQKKWDHDHRHKQQHNQPVIQSVSETGACGSRSGWYARRVMRIQNVTRRILLFLARGHANIWLVVGGVVNLRVDTIRSNGMIGMLFPARMHRIIGTVLTSSGVSLRRCVLLLRTLNIPPSSCGLQSVHHRHLNVHQHHVKQERIVIWQQLDFLFAAVTVLGDTTSLTWWFQTFCEFHNSDCAVFSGGDCVSFAL